MCQYSYGLLLGLDFSGRNEKKTYVMHVAYMYVENDKKAENALLSVK